MKVFISKISDIEKNKYSKNRFLPRVGILIIALIVLLIWHGLSLIYTPLVLPGPIVTTKALVSIVKSGSLFNELTTTLYRFTTGLLISIVIGSVFGILMGFSGKIRSMLEPFVYIVQATPPILYMTIAMIWFGLNGRATIFIVFIGSSPVMTVNIMEGFENIDTKLIEMGKAFRFSKTKMIKEIVLPSLSTYFKAGLITVFSFGWKLVVMGEVLSASTGLGAQITDSRMNLQIDKVFAWGIIIILFCFLFQKTTSILFQSKNKRRKKHEL